MFCFPYGAIQKSRGQTRKKGVRGIHEKFMLLKSLIKQNCPQEGEEGSKKSEILSTLYLIRLINVGSEINIGLPIFFHEIWKQLVIAVYHIILFFLFFL